MRSYARLFVALALVGAGVSIAACSQATPAAQAPVKVGSFTVATTDEVKSALTASGSVVVDARDNNAFIGWPLDGVTRGGHIQGATDFSAVWLGVKGKDADAQKAIDDKLLKLLDVKHIKAAKSVIVYGSETSATLLVATYLKTNSSADVKVYEVKDWAKDAALPMASYPNYTLLVPPTYVKDALGTADTKIFECSWGKEPDEYKAAHIPGAVHINTDEIEYAPLWTRRPVKELEKFAAANGITADTKVILYGSDSMPAHRVQVILKWMGVKDVRVLNGGMQSWVRAGFETEKGSNPKVAGGPFGVVIPGRPDYIVDMPGAKAILADPVNASLVDIRSWDEHIGKTPGYSDITVAGRPTGSRWGGDMPGDNANVDGTMRNFDEVLANWAEWGIKPTQKLGFFCGTGWRAAQMLTYADVAGLKDIALWDSGWYEWIKVGKNPISTGVPTKP